jgi:hypothetical protein
MTKWRHRVGLDVSPLLDRRVSRRQFRLRTLRNMWRDIRVGRGDWNSLNCRAQLGRWEESIEHLLLCPQQAAQLGRGIDKLGRNGSLVLPEQESPAFR